MKTETTLGYKLAGIGEIPEEWEVVKLGDERFFLILPSGIDHFSGTKEYLSTKSIESDEIIDIESKITYGKRPSRANMQPKVGSVWFAKMKNTVKVYCFTSDNQDETKRFILSTGFTGILCKEGIDPWFLKQIFLWDYFNKVKDRLADGSTQKAVNFDGIQSILIPIPPYPEQRKIAEILSTVDEAIKETDDIIKRTQELKRGLMQQLLIKGIGHTRFKRTEIGEIPEEWGVVKLEDVLSQPPQYGLSVKLFSKGNYPILKMDNLEDGRAVIHELKYANIDKKLFDQFKLEKGDILFNRTNAFDLVGRVGIFLLDEDFTFASYLIRLKISREKADPFFVNYY